MLIDGRAIANSIYESVAKRVTVLPFEPVFCDVLVGSDAASVQYVNLKAKKAEQVGIRFMRAEFPESISQEALIENIADLGKSPHLCGLIVQLPLPAQFNTQAVLDAINSEVDVDCLTTSNIELFYHGSGAHIPPTAAAVMDALDSVPPQHAGASYVVVGKGPLVGRPVAHLLQMRGCKVNIIDSKTERPEVVASQADVVITGVGRPNMITAEWVKPGAIVIDAGTAEDGGSIVGDVDMQAVEPVAAWVTPTPGGVGPITVAKLLENVVAVAERKVG